MLGNLSKLRFNRNIDILTASTFQKKWRELDPPTGHWWVFAEGSKSSFALLSGSVSNELQSQVFFPAAAHS